MQSVWLILGTWHYLLFNSFHNSLQDSRSTVYRRGRYFL